ncbi:MAG TPA: biotin--[acetyl-CoA-carboxylase] ligase, partial [Acidimicrobiales bacterium]
VLVADHQTAGHGRLGREWTAPPGSSLLVSVLLRPDLAPGDAFLVLGAAAVAACDACRDVAGCHPGIKWPNDLVIVAGDRFAGRKIAGLLAETIVRDGRLEAVVVGMGLNVNWDDRPPSALDEIAVALDRIVGRPVDRDALLESWLRGLDHWLTELDTPEGRERLQARVRNLSATVGRRVRVEQASGTLVGDAVDITPAGHLVISPDGGGPRIEVAVGDVVHLRHRD